jgi:hypothetical protein
MSRLRPGWSVPDSAVRRDAQRNRFSVKFSLIETGLVGLALFSACRFDRSPIVREQGAHGSGPNDSNGVISQPTNAVDGGEPHAGEGPGGLVGNSPGAHNPDAAVPDAAASVPAALQCTGTFCPGATSPARPCCTERTDVDLRAARVAGSCGVDLREIGTSSYGQSCWQRDQLGIVDDRCPAVAAAPGIDPEPGCCTDDGQCGTIDSRQRLGCRHAPGSEARSCGQPMTTTCDPLGTYALRIVIDAAWGGSEGFFSELTEAGRDKIQIDALLDVTAMAADGKLDLTGRVCGVAVPTLHSPRLCEAYQPSFANTLWDSNQVPAVPLVGRYECAAGGCVLSIDPATYLLGVELANPEATWPTVDQTQTLRCASGNGVQCFPDQDHDGYAGVQVNLATTGMTPANANTACPDGYQLRGLPLSENFAAIANGVRRADRLALGTRIRIGGSSRFAMDCNQGTGSAETEYVNSRAAGCLVQQGTFDIAARGADVALGPNTPCAVNEAHSADSALPTYTVLSPGATPDPDLKISDTTASPGPVVRMLRMGPASAAISCDQVRAAQF